MSGQDVAISFIHHMNELDIYMNTLANLADVGNDQLAARLKEIEDLLTQMEKVVSICVGFEGKTLMSYYTNMIQLVKRQHETLIQKIVDREATGVQFNSNGTIYNEGNLISEIKVIEDEYSDVVYPNSMISQMVHMDTIVQPNEYSNVALVNRMKQDYECINQLHLLTNVFFGAVITQLNRINAAIRNVKSWLCNAEEIEKICLGDGMDIMEIRQILDASSTMLPLGDEVIKLNTVYMELSHNYQVYALAVNSYTSTVLESAFGDNIEF